MSATTPIDPPVIEPPPPKGAMAAIFLIVLSDLMGFGLIIPALPFYAREYKATDFQVTLLFAIYSTCQLIASPILGLASDRFGRRPILILSQLGSVSGYMILAFASAVKWVNPLHGLLLVYLSRFIDGFSGGNISTAQAYVSDVSPVESRAKSMGMLGAAFGIGFSIGPAIGGLLAHLHPSFPALGAGLFSAVAALMTYLRLKEPTRHTRISETQFWLHPSRFKPVLRNPLLVQMMGIGFFSMLSFVMLEVVFAMYMHDRFGFQELGVGLFFGFAGIVIIIVQGGLMGRLNKRFTEWPLVITGPVLVTIAMIVYIMTTSSAIGWHVGVGMILFAGLFNAVGRSMQTPPLQSLISQNSDRTQQGMVFGMFHMLSSLARAIGPLLVGLVYTQRTRAAPFVVAGSITLVVAIWSTTLWRRGMRHAA